MREDYCCGNYDTLFDTVENFVYWDISLFLQIAFKLGILQLLLLNYSALKEEHQNLTEVSNSQEPSQE